MVLRYLDLLIRNPWYGIYAALKRMPWIVSDVLFVRIMYRGFMGRWPNLTNPKRFTEKLQWLKLYDHRSHYTKIVDKLAVKDYVSEILGDGYVFKTLAIWNCAEDIDFSALPSKFVLKCNHFGGGEVFICKDKSKFDYEGVRKTLRGQLKKNLYNTTREWPYRDVPRKVFAEEYMEDEFGELRDYKFYCLNGRPQFVLIASNRYSTHNFDSYDMDFKPLTTQSNSGAPNPNGIAKPRCFEEMVAIAGRLSKAFPFVRVDLYCILGRVYLGELTLYPASGLDNRHSDVWDVDFGARLILPREKPEG